MPFPFHLVDSGTDGHGKVEVSTSANQLSGIERKFPTEYLA